MVQLSVVFALTAVAVAFVAVGAVYAMERVAPAMSFEAAAGRCLIRWLILGFAFLVVVGLIVAALYCEAFGCP